MSQLSSTDSGVAAPTTTETRRRTRGTGWSPHGAAGSTRKLRRPSSSGSCRARMAESSCREGSVPVPSSRTHPTWTRTLCAASAPTSASNAMETRRCGSARTVGAESQRHPRKKMSRPARTRRIRRAQCSLESLARSRRGELGRVARETPLMTMARAAVAARSTTFLRGGRHRPAFASPSMRKAVSPQATYHPPPPPPPRLRLMLRAPRLASSTDLSPQTGRAASVAAARHGRPS